MLISCPACRFSFTVPHLGIYACPQCGGQVSVAASPAAPPRTNNKGKLGTGLAIGFGALIMISAIASSDERDTRSSVARSNPTPSESAEPSIFGAASSSSPCEVAMPKLRAMCPRAGGFLDGECQSSEHPVITGMAVPEQVRPGSFINLGNSGPEWFLREDGILLTVNGVAMSQCDGLQDVAKFTGRTMAAEAPQRGDTAKTYEGVYGPDGEYLFEDCSQFEIRIARIYNEALWEDPDSSDKAAGRRAARAVEKAGVKPKVGEAIYMKAMAQCMQAIHAP